MTFFIKKPVTFPRISGVRFWRNHIISILPLDIIQYFIASVCPVSKNCAVGNIKMRQNIDSNGRVMDISRAQLDIDWIPKTIYNSMDFCRFTSTASSNKLVLFAVYCPFLAPALCGCALMTVESKESVSISES